MATTRDQRRHAVVVGASMAGLSAARMLADRYDAVTVLERDELPDDAVARRGVPQGRHLHVLLAAGARQLERWFPGLGDELVAQGAQRSDAADGVLFHAGGRRSHAPTGIDAIAMSRPLLEGTVRRRLAASPGVSVLDRTAVAGVRASSDGGRVTGVVLGDGGELDADLVVDTSGRSGGCLRSLTALGYDLPPTTSITIRVAYASLVLERDPADGQGYAFVIPEAPRETRGGGAFPIEGDRWIVTLAGWFDDAPPTDLDGFRRFAGTLADPSIAALLDRAAPLGDVVAHRYPSSQLRHFERLRRHPSGYIALGDVVCSFNPVFGQGMTSAALQAAALGELLDRASTASPDFVRRHHRRAARIVAAPWRTAALADLAYPQTEGARPAGATLVNRYLARAARAAHGSAAVNRRLFEVQHLLAPPTSVFAPATAVRVLVGGRRRPGASGRVAPVAALEPSSSG